MAERKLRNSKGSDGVGAKDAANALATRRARAWRRVQGLFQQRVSEYGWNQRRLAEVAGVSAATVSRVLGNVDPPALDTIERIADALGISEDEVNRLTADDFDFGSPEQKLRMLILRAIVRDELPPADVTEDIRSRLDRYEDSEFVELSYNRVQRNRVLASLLEDGYLDGSLQGLLTPRRLSTRIDLCPVLRIEVQLKQMVYSACLRLGERLRRTLDEIMREMSPELPIVSIKEMFKSLEYTLLMLADGDLWEVRMSSVYLGMLKHTYDVALGHLHHTKYTEFYEDFCLAIREHLRLAVSPYLEQLAGSEPGYCIDFASAATCNGLSTVRCDPNGGSIVKVIKKHFSEEEIEITPSPIVVSIENTLNSMRE